MVTRPRNLSQADPYFDSVVFLAPFSGVDGATSATDLSNSGHTLTFNGTAALDGDIRKFGFTSLLLDGDSDFVTAPHSADWAFGSGDFTVECWVNFNALPSTETSGMCMLAHYRNTGNDRSWFFNFETNNELKFWWSTNGSTLESLESTTTPTLSTNTWYHVAACRDGGTLRIFFNGTNIGESTAITGDTLFDSTQVLDIGKLQSEGFPLRYMNGWIENVRITKGVARYTTAFTPPERAYQDVKEFGMVRNNLALAYEMDDIYGSWQGEPTTNLANTAGGATDWTNNDLGAAVITRTTIDDGNIYRLTSTTGGGGRMDFQVSKLTNNLTYNLSLKYKFISGTSPSFTLTDWCDTSITKTTTTYDDYTYETAYGVRATYDATYRFMDYSISDNTVVEIWDVQLEERNYATPYTQSSRDNTEALIDWAGGNTITASSLTYGTDNTFSFNGTSDYVQTSTLPSFTAADEFSVGCVIKPDSTTINAFFITPGGLGLDRFVSTTTGGKLRLTLCQSADTGQRTFDSTVSLTTTKYQHWMITINGTDINFYLNGELDSNHTDVSGFAVGQWGGYVWTIGQRGNSTFWYGGDIVAVQAYDRVIPQGEVRQIYNSTKSRFGF